VVNKMRQRNELCAEGWGSTCAWLRGAQLLKDFVGRDKEMGQNDETDVV